VCVAPGASRAVRSCLTVACRRRGAQFWRQYKDGQRFATRSTVYDVIFAVLNGTTRTDEPVINFVLHWIMVTVSNFTVGMLSAVTFFIFSLPGLIWSYSASVWSGLLFFAVASVSAAAVTATYLGALYGAAGGAVYASLRVASNQARLQEARRERAAQLGGGGQGRRQHAD